MQHVDGSNPTTLAAVPGAHFDDAHEVALRVLVDGMRQLGMLRGSADEIIEQGSYRRYYMHRTSHWLGMDVHDVGLYRVDGASRVLEPGPAGYSDLAVLPDGNILCLFERGDVDHMADVAHLTLARFDFDWLNTGRE